MGYLHASSAVATESGGIPTALEEKCLTGEKQWLCRRIGCSFSYLLLAVAVPRIEQLSLGVTPILPLFGGDTSGRSFAS